MLRPILGVKDYQNCIERYKKLIIETFSVRKIETSIGNSMQKYQTYAPG